jgi:hypothetical protein
MIDFELISPLKAMLWIRIRCSFTPWIRDVFPTDPGGVFFGEIFLHYLKYRCSVIFLTNEQGKGWFYFSSLFLCTGTVL